MFFSSVSSKASAAVSPSYDVDVWIGLGQSNMQGTSEDPWVTTPDTLASATFYEWDADTSQFVEISGAPNRTTGAGVLGYLNGSAAGNGYGGFQQRMLKNIQAVGSKPIYYIQHAPGASGIVSGITYGGGNWTDTHLTAAKSDITASLAALDAAGTTYRIRGFIWQQGEADSTALNTEAYTNPASYSSALSAIIDSLWTSYGSDYLQFGSGNFFNIVANFGQPATGSNQRWPGTLFNRNYDIWDIQRTFSVVNTRAACICLRGAFLGDRGLLHDNVHATIAGYNDVGDACVEFLNNSGAVLNAQAPASAVSSSTRTTLNALLAWTNNAATPRRNLIERKESVSSNWEIIGIADTTETSRLVGTPDREKAYDFRVTTWGDDGYFPSSSLQIAAFGSQPSVPSDFFTASGVTGAPATNISSIMADLVSGGFSLKDISAFWIFRTDYNANAGTTVYDIMGNCNLTVNGTVARNADHYACNGIDGDMQGDYPLPYGNQWSMIRWHKQATNEASLIRLGRSQPPDLASADGTSFYFQMLTNTSGAYRFESTTTGLWINTGGTNYSSAISQIDGTVRSVMYTRNTDYSSANAGDLEIYANGLSTRLAASPKGVLGSFLWPVYTIRFGRAANTYYANKDSLCMLWNRQLTGAQYAAINTILGTYL